MRHIHPRSVLLVVKSGHQSALRLAEEISEWLRKRGMPAQVTENRDDLSTCLGQPKPMLVLVLGGDGTMISVSRKTCGDETAILGINFARIGFLTECPKDTWRAVLGGILESGAMVSSRLLLDVCLLRDGVPLLSTTAVNDIVVGRGNLARLINLELFIEEERIAALRADGLILSTPTGSSAYSFSAGGPLIHPELEVICTTPICSFLTEIKPLVLPASRRVRIRVNEDTAEAFLTLDGQSGYPLQNGDEVSATGSSRKMHLVAFSDTSYYQKLKAKGFLQDC